LSLFRTAKAEPRSYQLLAAENALARGNTLVVMPTALGKTFVALLLAAHLLKTTGKKILFLAPTKPLALQQAEKFRELIEIPRDEIVVVTGEVKQEERAEEYSNARVVVGTPQTVANDLKKNLLSLKDFSLVVVDEAHRAVGNYAFVFVSEKAVETGALVLGLTASPSADRKKIEEVCENLGIKHVEVKTAKDEDIVEYVKPVELDWIFVDFPKEFVELRNSLREWLDEVLNALKQTGFTGAYGRVTKRDLLALRIRLLTGSGPSRFWALSLLARAMNLMHAIDLLETEGVGALENFWKGMGKREKTTKAVQALLKDERYANVLKKAEGLIGKKIEHPKMAKMREIVGAAAAEGKSTIVFAHYRDSVDTVLETLEETRFIKARKLVGRSGEGGMTQKQQAELLDAFRAKEFNVLVATQVGEEGLDIPAVDLVLFYESVPSEIRLIQRRGRAGRVKAGKTIILITKDTKDEAFHWISRKKEEKMHKMLKSMTKKMGASQAREKEKPAVERTPKRKKETKQSSMAEFL
jgi:Fanconi anemia group M protein